MTGVAAQAEVVTEAEAVRHRVVRWAESCSPSILAAADARGVLEAAVAIKHAASTVEGLAAKALGESAVWRQSGDRSAAHLLSRLSGTSVNDARETLATAERLEELPAVQAAARRGELSPRQSSLISEAVTADPSAAKELLDTAKAASLGELSQACARRRAAADPDPDATRARIHRRRYLRTHQDTEGAWNLHARATADAGARIMAALAPFAEERFQAARRAGRREPLEAYQLDALTTMAEVASACPVDAAGPAGAGPAGAGGSSGAGGPAGAGGSSGAGGPAGAGGSSGAGGPAGAGGSRGTASTAGFRGAGGTAGSPNGTGSRGTAGSDGTGSGPARSGGTGAGGTGSGAAAASQAASDPADLPRRRPPVKIIVRIDMDALVRGRPQDGETCEIAGVGPVPVSVVRDMLASDNPFLAAVVTKGKAVAGVVHLGRRPTAAQMTALEWLSPSCSVLGCSQSARLEIDHVEDWADTHVTRIEKLAPLCGHHHWLKTNQDWALVDGIGKRAMVPPGDPRHPKRVTQAKRANATGPAQRTGPSSGDGPRGRTAGRQASQSANDARTRRGPPGARENSRRAPPDRDADRRISPGQAERAGQRNRQRRAPPDQPTLASGW